MSATKLSCFAPDLLRVCFPVLWLAVGSDRVGAQAVPSQANIDASAQRRLQETAREAQRQRRIEEQIRILVPALSPQNLTGDSGPVLTRKAIAALARLRQDGIPPDEAVSRAIRSARLESGTTAKPSAYLRRLWADHSDQLDEDTLSQLEAGQDPGSRLRFPDYQP